MYYRDGFCGMRRHAYPFGSSTSGAGVEPFSRIGAYGATKPALRLAGMILAAELDMRQAGGALPPEVPAAEIVRYPEADGHPRFARATIPAFPGPTHARSPSCPGGTPRVRSASRA